jgi:hypothetical protein
LKRCEDCQRTFKIKEKICIIISVGTTVNTKRKRNALQNYKNAEMLLWKSQCEKVFLNIYYLLRQTGDIATPCL